MCHIEAKHRRLPIFSAGNCRWCSEPCHRLSHTLKQERCGHWPSRPPGVRKPFQTFQRWRTFCPGMKRAIKGELVRPSTPTGIIDKLNTEINAGLAHPKIKARLADLGAMPLAGSPADFAQLIADETEKWGKVIKFAGIKAQ